MLIMLGAKRILESKLKGIEHVCLFLGHVSVSEFKLGCCDESLKFCRGVDGKERRDDSGGIVHHDLHEVSDFCRYECHNDECFKS